MTRMTDAEFARTEAGRWMAGQMALRGQYEGAIRKAVAEGRFNGEGVGFLDDADGGSARAAGLLARLDARKAAVKSSAPAPPAAAARCAALLARFERRDAVRRAVYQSLVASNPHDYAEAEARRRVPA